MKFDRYFSEKSFSAEDAVNKALDELRNNDNIEDHEGAIWFRYVRRRG